MTKCLWFFLSVGIFRQFVPRFVCEKRQTFWVAPFVCENGIICLWDKMSVQTKRARQNVWGPTDILGCTFCLWKWHYLSVGQNVCGSICRWVGHDHRQFVSQTVCLTDNLSHILKAHQLNKISENSGNCQLKLHHFFFLRLFLWIIFF